MKIRILILFVFLTALIRVVPHPPNFAPVTALALFSGVTFSNRLLGMLIPLAATAISDLYLGFYSISIWVYFAFILINLLGSFVKTVNLKNILLSSVIFFIVTNFGVWLLGYPKTIEGFVLCYTLAIPFFAYSIAGDLFFSYVLKYSFNFVEQKWIIARY